MTRHPPLKEGETFLGNTSSKTLEPYLFPLAASIRFATPAYTINGKVLDGYFAMITTNPKATDQYNQIMENRLAAIRAGM